MRTPDDQQQKMFFHLLAEKRILKKHPLRLVEAMVEECLKELDERFSNMYPAIHGRTSSHDGYASSQRERKRIEDVFGWIKTVACLHKLRHRGARKVERLFAFAAAAYNLVRMRNLAVT